MKYYASLCEAHMYHTGLPCNHNSLHFVHASPAAVLLEQGKENGENVHTPFIQIFPPVQAKLELAFKGQGGNHNILNSGVDYL